MARPASSDSEGEIVETRHEKATTALPSAKDSSVNRRLREALSPDASPPPARDSRQRSRSPYRAGRLPALRGEKRRHDADRHHTRRDDSQKFDQRSDDRPRASLRQFGNSTSYADRSRDAYRNHDDGRDNKRRRTRSRSSERSDNRGRYDRTARKSGLANGTQARADTGGPSKELSVDRERKPAHLTDRNVASAQSSSSQPTGRGANGTATSAQDALHVDDATAGRPADENLSIEERRKRREAIRAKYKGQAAPLLVQALQPGSVAGSLSSRDDPASAKSDRSASPAQSATGTASGPGSPQALAFANDADLANANAVASIEEGESPSAADYDPTMDMQEHRFRPATEGVSAQTYDEKKGDDQDIVVPAGDDAMTHQLKPTHKSSADDMFASDDEDDMFAPTAPEPKAKGSAMTVPLAQAKELDQSLLDNWDDPDAYYRFIKNELIDGRYEVLDNLGRGIFSSVVRARDITKDNHMVAIKIIRNIEAMLKAGTKEMEILERLGAVDAEDKKHVIRLERSFMHKGHLCMVFESLSINLREVLKKFGRDVGINIKAIRSYAQQMFIALGHLRRCNLLHADLKPDNILVNEARSTLKIADLGSAFDASEGDITEYLVSRFYRAPEIILGIPHDFAIDMWSIGCTLFELYTGKILFTGRTNNQMLRSIMECRGKFSLKLLKKAEFGAVHFDDQNLNFRSVEIDRVTGREVTKLVNFVRPVRDLKTRLFAASQKGMPESEIKELNLFADLLDRCLALNPEKRLTPADALKHPFIYRVPSHMKV